MSDRMVQMTQSIGVKILVISILVGLLAFVVTLQDDLVKERQDLRDSAVNRTIAEWGGQQRFVGPIVRIPYRRVVELPDRTNQVFEGYVYALPDELSVDVDMKGEKRQRGIYEVPLYVAQVRLEGSFRVLNWKSALPAHAVAFPEKAELWYALSSAVGLAERPQVLWRTKPVESQRSALEATDNSNFDAFSIPIDLSAMDSKSSFSMALTVKGGGSFGVFPAGLDTLVKIQNDLGLPEFGPAFLPIERTVTETGFKAEWRIPSLARKIPSVGAADEWGAVVRDLQFAAFDLQVGFDAYRSINRATKYALLFVLVPFVGLFLYEIFLRRKLHPIQYLLVGFAVVIFYLLLLSLSERIDFNWAFVVSSAAVSTLVGVYCASILKGGWAGLGCFVGMSGLYALLYLIISSEDNALLVGSFFLFALLALVMFVTRRVDWFKAGKSFLTSSAEEKVPSTPSEN